MADAAHDDLADRLRRAGATVTVDATAASLSTYRVGGPVAVLARIDRHVDVESVTMVLSENEAPTLVVGRGSNLLVADAGFPGVVVMLGSEFEAVAIDGTTVVAGGAASLPVVARATAAAGLTGFEWAVGVPGSIGGAVRMNAGGHGSDMSASLKRVTVADLRTGEVTSRTVESLALGYRSSAVHTTDLVLDATLALATGDAAASNASLREIVSWRREHQPGGQNAGSVFTNPDGDSAGRLIDAAGLKGHRIGTAEVSTKHANFIQADPGGSADDVAALMADVIARVAEAHGVRLVPETVMVGFGEPQQDQDQEMEGGV